jgi:hypothetical protein
LGGDYAIAAYAIGGTLLTLGLALLVVPQFSFARR